MDYQVPQFIEVEDRIFGPFTLKQFIYIAGGIGICALLLVTLPLFLAIFIGAPLGALAAALAFYKVNNKPFIEILEAGFNYYVGKRLYLWKKDKEDAIPTAPTKVVSAESASNAIAGLSRSKLEDLAWKLDVKDLNREESPT
jgi:hypothetical protein